MRADIVWGTQAMTGEINGVSFFGLYFPIACIRAIFMCGNVYQNIKQAALKRSRVIEPLACEKFNKDR
jgi:hypothetical protein